MVRAGGCASLPCPPVNPLQPPQPLFFSLTLSSDTETGSASSSTTPFATVTDPNFSFLGIHPPLFQDSDLSFTITWTAVAGQLTALSIDYLVMSSDFSIVGSGYPGLDPGGFGLNGGTLVYAGGGCLLFPICVVTGFWQEANAEQVPEPESLTLLLSALLGLGLIAYRHRAAS